MDKCKKPAKSPVFCIYIGMFNVKYNYSSVHVDVPNPLAVEIIEWGKKQITDDEIYVTQKDPTFGREDEIHTTILYGIHSENPDEIREIVGNSGTITAKLGKVGVFTNPYRFDVVMIEVISEDLRRLNKILDERIKYTNKYGEYKPHVTIAYVKKGKGWRHFGQSKWKDREFSCQNLIFSSRDGSKHHISL